MDRAITDTDTLLRIVLALAVIWLVLEILETVLGVLFGTLRFLQPLLVVALIVLVVAYFLDWI